MTGIKILIPPTQYINLVYLGARCVSAWTVRVISMSASLCKCTIKLHITILCHIAIILHVAFFVSIPEGNTLEDHKLVKKKVYQLWQINVLAIFNIVFCNPKLLCGRWLMAGFEHNYVISLLVSKVC